MLSPHTRAIAQPQPGTATGKLNAEMMPTTPSGCHCSSSRCDGRSDCISRPYNWRDRPTAKSHTSMTSCTSPRASLRILPFSRLISRARSSLRALKVSPNRRTISPRRGAGTWRHALNARCAATTVSSYSAWLGVRTLARVFPEVGSSDSMTSPSPRRKRPPAATPLTVAPGSKPKAERMSATVSARAVEDAVSIRVATMSDG